jgi:hypothetical protein
MIKESVLEKLDRLKTLREARKRYLKEITKIEKELGIY